MVFVDLFYALLIENCIYVVTHMVCYRASLCFYASCVGDSEHEVNVLFVTEKYVREET